MHDLLITDANVADGTGSPLRRVDVAVKDATIVAIGDLKGEAAKETLVADGLILAPGFVDIHTHYDAQITWDPLATPSTSLGVTTVIAGNCGFGIAPCKPQYRDLLARNLSIVEGMSIDALRAGVRWDYETFPEYLEMLETQGIVPNMAVFAGHSVTRTYVMGEEASLRAATEDEIVTMHAMVKDALNAGAVGFATSYSHNHFGDDGLPMPSRIAERAETDALVGALAEADHGVFQIANGPDVSVADMESWASMTGRPAFFSALLHTPAFPDRPRNMLREAAEAQQRGHQVYAQVTSQPFSMEFTLENAYPMGSLDVWEPLIGANPDQISSTISDMSFRDAFRAQLADPKRGKIFYGDWSRVEIAGVTTPENRAIEGDTIGLAAEKSGTDPIDFFFDLSLDENLKTVFVAQMQNIDEDAVGEMIKHPASVIALSDAGAHLSFLCDAGYGLYLLARWVREKRSLSIEEAVRQLTSVQADLYGIIGRGRIREGNFADLVLFDPATVGVSKARRAFDLPGDASRLVRDPIGVHGVWINGTRIWDGTEYCVNGTRPGHVLRRFAS
jgi:N-acyl-D-amino-acid deacylase